MKTVKDDFDKRKSELDDYFNFLLKLDKDVPILHFSEKGINQTFSVDDELLKILKANGFLLIYNLVEAFCRNSLLEILMAIQNKKLTLKKLSEDAQRIWIAQKIKNHKESNTEKLEDCFLGMTTDIINNTVIEFSSVIQKITTDEKFDAFGLSGNIDKKKIRELADKYGFKKITLPNEEKAGEALDEIKDNRNKLAHGRITFRDCGKGKSVTQMVDYKNNAIEYLEGVLTNVEDYITATKFKK